MNKNFLKIKSDMIETWDTLCKEKYHEKKKKLVQVVENEKCYAT